MKKIFATSLVVAFSGCGYGPSTGFDPIDNVVSPKSTCERYFKLTNQSSQTLHMKAGMHERIMDARCTPSSQEEEKLVPPGVTAEILLEMKCRTCGDQSVGTQREVTGFTAPASGEHWLCKDTGCTAVPF